MSTKLAQHHKEIQADIYNGQTVKVIAKKYNVCYRTAKSYVSKHIDYPEHLKARNQQHGNTEAEVKTKISQANPFICSKRAENKQREIARRTRIAEQMVDNDITLEGLYKRDKGVCHICGGKCDYEDYVVSDQAIICGDWYPSIDHVIPLSKGGEHSWDNVKLAHRICNSKKSNR